MYGRLDGDNQCGNCIDLDKLIKDSTPNLTVPLDYKYVNVDTPEGKSFADQHKVDDIPVTEVCEIFQSGKEDCKSLTGLDPVKEVVTKYTKK